MKLQKHFTNCASTVWMCSVNRVLEWLLKLLVKLSYLFQENMPVEDDEVMVIDFLNKPFF